MGASGSSAINTRLFVRGGAPLHLRGGETFLSSQVCFAGIGAPSANAALVNCIWPVWVLSAAREFVKPGVNSKEQRTAATRLLVSISMKEFTSSRASKQPGHKLQAPNPKLQ